RQRQGASVDSGTFSRPVSRMKLYTIVEAVPSRVIGLANLLQALGRQPPSRDGLLALLQPPGLRRGKDEDPNMARQVIEAAEELGVVEEFVDDGGTVCVRLTETASASTGYPSGERWVRWITKRV